MLQTKGLLTYDKKHMGNPCGKYITDKEFLIHMIPHHQVAIDMSKEVMGHSTDPNIIYLARNIIFGQTDEILLMENMLLSSIPNMSSDDKYKLEDIPNQFTVYYPKESRADEYQCGLHHFSTNMAKEHKLKKEEPFTDEQYMKEMINHHDVAIEMSNRIMKYSTNPAIRTFANEIIKGQRYEIWLMKQYLQKNNQKQCAPLFFNGDPNTTLNDKKYNRIEGFYNRYLFPNILTCCIFFTIFIIVSCFIYKHI